MKRLQSSLKGIFSSFSIFQNADASFVIAVANCSLPRRSGNSPASIHRFLNKQVRIGPLLTGEIKADRTIHQHP